MVVLIGAIRMMASIPCRLFLLGAFCAAPPHIQYVFAWPSKDNGAAAALRPALIWSGLFPPDGIAGIGYSSANKPRRL
jgi:hypothetical protein